MRRQGAKGPSGAPVHQLLMISLLAALVLTTCSHEGDNGGVAVPYNPLWVDVNTTNLHTVVTEDYIDLSGDAYCDSCPSGEVAFGYCPPTSLMQSSAINLTWSNITTGQGGDILYHGIVGSCSCLFSYCFTSYSHSWLVQGLPLEMGDNVIEITAYDASGNVATDTVTITRAPIPNLKQPDGIAVDTVNDEILVASTGNSSIVVYARTASGLATPKRIISGASTGLLYPVGIAVDTVNNEILVTDYNFINVYLRTATGDAAPIRTISGAATGLSLPQGIAVDTANDEIFVVNRDWNNMRIMVFPRTASGDAVPIRTIAGTSTNLSSPWSITVDTVNNEIMAIDSDYNCINVYSRSTSGNAAPVRTISGAATGLNHPHGIAVDTAHDEIIAGNGYANIASINAYSRTASGDTAPVRMISGPSTSFYYPYGIAVDTVNDEIFVVNSYSSPLRAYITVYPRSSSGNVAPSRTIFGAYPGL